MIGVKVFVWFDEPDPKIDSPVSPVLIAPLLKPYIGQAQRRLPFGIKFRGSGLMKV